MKLPKAPNGFRMRQVLDGCPWPSMLHAAEAVAPRGNRRIGYQIVHRALKAGLVKLDPTKKSWRSSKGAVVRADQ